VILSLMPFLKVDLKHDDNVPPIHRIPVELLGEIFKHYLDEAPQTRRKNIGTSRLTTGYLTTVNPIILGHICLRWRNISLSMPTLWSSLAIYRPKLSQIPLIRLWLKRSGVCPLTLSLSQTIDGDVTQVAATRHILSYFVRCARRWQSIRLSLYDGPPYEPLLNLPPGTAGMLESAHLDLPDWNYEDIDRLWSTFHSSPSLRRVAWGSEYDFQQLPTHIPWKQLTHITARNIITSTPEELLHVLQSCKNLHEFHISTSWSYTVRVQILATPIVLPNLQHLKIYAEGSSSAPLLSQVTLPALDSLQLYHTSLSYVDVQKPRSCSFLTDLVVRSACRLQHFSLTDKGVTEADLAGFLSAPAASSLREISLVLGSIAEPAVKMEACDFCQ